MMNLCKILIGIFLLHISMTLCAKTVKASSFGFDPADATECLQKAINSGAKTVIVDNTGKEWIIRPVFLVSDQEIVFEKDVTIRAKKGEFKGVEDSLFTASAKKNIILRGNGNVRLIMNKVDYQDRKQYTPAEWRNCLNFLNCENVTIRNLNLIGSGGDGIYLGNDRRNKELSYCKNFLIQNVHVTDQHRQGISVISAENLLIRNCSFNNTSGTLPGAGIDFEPNSSRERLVNCVVEKCVFNGNQGSGVEFFLDKLTADTIPVSVTVKECSMTGNKNANINYMAGKSKNVRGVINFSDCKLVSQGNLNIMLQSVDFAINFRNMSIDNNKNPLEAISISSKSITMGNITFDRVEISDRKNNTAIGTALLNGKIPQKISVSGNITLNGKAFDVAACIKDYENIAATLQDGTKEADVKNFAIPKKTISRKISRVWIRSPFKFIRYCRQNSPLEINAATQVIGRNKKKITIKLYDPDGELLVSRELAPGESLTLNNKAAKTGFYTVECNPLGSPATITSQKSGQAVIYSGALNFLRPSGNIYFEVPAGTENFSIMVAGDPGEYLTASLVNPAGKTVMSKKNFCTPTAFKATRKKHDAAEVWSIRFSNAKEDVSIMPVSGVNAAFATDPQLLLRMK
ncbi:MAG: right-handed parallel beta-helix repeat-containing protein [Lentisphaerae bacterium]|nr:right-handed parallel beta-helix repeat-containing protein [Lentisphaerota bacterium]